jgi:phage/plasmid-associated DNA primase
MPAMVDAAVAAYREESDPLGAFLSEACRVTHEAEIGAQEFYKHYRLWADGHHYAGVELLTATKFGRLVGERFSSRKDARTGVKFYRGLAKRGAL